MNKHIILTKVVFCYIFIPIFSNLIIFKQLKHKKRWPFSQKPPFHHLCYLFIASHTQLPLQKPEFFSRLNDFRFQLPIHHLLNEFHQILYIHLLFRS